MADDISISSTITTLPDEIAKTITSSFTISPADANDKHYYKLSAVDNTSSDLIAGYFTDYTAVDSSTAPTAIDSADLVKFLMVVNKDTTNDVYMVFDGGTASTSEADAVKVRAGGFFFGEIPNTTVANLHAVSSTGTVNCEVYALIDDVA